MMAQEMSHRMKNMLATVNSIVNQSMRGNQPVDAMRQNITERLDALARSHDVLGGRDFGSASIRDAVDKAIEPFNTSGRIQSAGPDFDLTHQAGTSLALALHELATNAVKYGALSNNNGQVRVEWFLEADNFVFVWKETGGPSVRQPERTGFGSRLIKMLGISLQGSATIDYQPDGVVFEARTSRASLSAQ